MAYAATAIIEFIIHQTLCFDAVGWAAGRASACKKTEWWGASDYLSGARCRLAYGPADATATHCLLLQ